MRKGPTLTRRTGASPSSRYLALAEPIRSSPPGSATTPCGAVSAARSSRPAGGRVALIALGSPLPYASPPRPSSPRRLPTVRQERPDGRGGRDRRHRAAPRDGERGRGVRVARGLDRVVTRRHPRQERAVEAVPGAGRVDELHRVPREPHPAYGV